MNFGEAIANYGARLNNTWNSIPPSDIGLLADAIIDCITSQKRLFVCGNGGSGANAIHIENDFVYGISKQIGRGLKCQALSSNQAVLSCLANDEGYDRIFSAQIAIQGSQNDLLLVLSGSGQSTNILNAIETAKSMNIKTAGIIGFDGGKALNQLDIGLHVPIHDMQISEDIQMMIAHVISQHIFENRHNIWG